MPPAVQTLYPIHLNYYSNWLYDLSLPLQRTGPPAGDSHRSDLAKISLSYLIICRSDLKGLDDLVLNYEAKHRAKLEESYATGRTDGFSISVREYMEANMRTPPQQINYLEEEMKKSNVRVFDQVPYEYKTNDDPMFPHIFKPSPLSRKLRLPIRRVLTPACIGRWPTMHIDGAFSKGLGGGGLVIRNPNGLVEGYNFFALKKVKSPLDSEFSTAEKAVPFALAKGLEQLHIMGDCDDLYGPAGGFSDIKNELYPRFCRLFDTLKGFNNYLVTPTVREANKVANHLAGLGKLLAEGKMIMGRDIHIFGKLVANDKNGKAAYRFPLPKVKKQKEEDEEKCSGHK